MRDFEIGSTLNRIYCMIKFRTAGALSKNLQTRTLQTKLIGAWDWGEYKNLKGQKQSWLEAKHLRKGAILSS